LLAEPDDLATNLLQPLKLHVLGDGETGSHDERDYYFGTVFEGGGEGDAKAVSFMF